MSHDFGAHPGFIRERAATDAYQHNAQKSAADRSGRQGLADNTQQDAGHSAQMIDDHPSRHQQIHDHHGGQQRNRDIRHPRQAAEDHAANDASERHAN